MKIGLMTPRVMPVEAVALADSLRKSPLGLDGIIGLGSSMWLPKPARRLMSGIKRYGVAGTLLRVSGYAGNSHAVVASKTQPLNGPSIDSGAYAKQHALRHWCAPLANHVVTASVLQRAGLDVIVSYGGGILRAVLLNIPGVIFVNAHAGRLPSYGGMNVVEWAVYNNDPIYGTIHRIDRGIDTGEILAEAPLVLGRPATVGALRASAAAAVWNMVPGALTQLMQGEIRFHKQPGDERRNLWYRMHPELVKVVQAKLDDGSFFRIQEEVVARFHRNGEVGELPQEFTRKSASFPLE